MSHTPWDDAMKDAPAGSFRRCLGIVSMIAFDALHEAGGDPRRKIRT